MTQLVKTNLVGSVLVVTLNRPDVRNALSSVVLSELGRLCDELSTDRLTRAVVITGAGELAFSAGADLKERQGMTEVEALSFVQTIQATFQKIASLPMPTIAAINGDAFGGGLELALACDLRVMSQAAKIGLTECSLGIIPGAGGTQRLPRLIGIAQAMELIFSAKRLDATAALAMGLVNHVADGPLNTRVVAEELAEKIARNAPLAVRAAKEALLASQDKNLKDGLITELAAYHQILDSEDRKEGLRAFAEKRTPQFLGV